MLATVKSILFNQPLGTYKVTKLTVTTDKGEEKEYNIFTNKPFHNVVATLKPGDNIELKMEKNGKYWNVADVSLSHGVAVVNPTPKATTQSSGYKDNSVAIARAVALKAGVELYAALITAGMVKKTLKPDAAVEEIFAITKRFEGYTTCEEDIEALSTDTSSIEKDAGGEYEEAPFPE